MTDSVEKMDDGERLAKAMNLLSRAGELFEDSAPDTAWWRDYFLLAGEHMVCTEEGWEPGSAKAELVADYGPGHILDEVNAPRGTEGPR